MGYPAATDRLYSEPAGTGSLIHWAPICEDQPEPDLIIPRRKHTVYNRE